MSLTVEWSAAHNPQPGQSVSGDAYVVHTYPGGTLVAVIDGLGHGEKAAAAAQVAVQAVQSRAKDHPTDILNYCHTAARQTRGCVMSVASIKDDGTMTWVGVGNVAAIVFRDDSTFKPMREHLLVRGGVVGYRIPSLKPFTLTVNPGDTLLMLTDGIRSSYIEDIPYHASPHDIASHILSKHSRGTDDALVLAARIKAN